MRLFGKKELLLLTTTYAWEHFRCFGSPIGCDAVAKDVFCPLKESCIARFAEIMGFRNRQKMGRDLVKLLEGYE